MKYRKTGNLSKFKNCSILRGHAIVKEDLWVRNGKFVNPEKIFFDEKNFPDVEIDCNNALISPGFIDLQINGGFGIDFSQGVTPDKLDHVSRGLLAHGVTAYCPTLVTSPTDVYKKVLPELVKKDGGKKGAAVLGAHLEGPFINPQMKGAHPVEFMRNFKEGFGVVEEVYGSIENAAIITLAPELPGAMDVIKKLSQQKVIVSLGHSAATLKEAEQAVSQGATLVTHLFNAMVPFHHRDPGLVGLLASDNICPEKTVYYGIIADGVHTHAAALRIAYRTNPKGIILVTDAISALGFEEGCHRIGQKDVEVRSGRAYVAGTNTLCGSIGTMNESVRFFKDATEIDYSGWNAVSFANIETRLPNYVPERMFRLSVSRNEIRLEDYIPEDKGCSTVEALEAATLHPASVLGITDKKGVLEYGADADFVFLNEELRLLSTWIAGECVYKSPN